MKKIIALTLTMALTSMASFASNYPGNYCNASVTICEDGPGIVARISSGCSSGTYIIGYKKEGLLGSNSFVDAVVQFHFTGETIQKKYRITPDWNHLGFMTPEINSYDIAGGAPHSISIAFSNGNGIWDSKYGSNYFYPLDFQASDKTNNCYTVKIDEVFTSTIPFLAWEIINAAMRK
jgi:hypothetical protein